jgi:hypothetical protein
MTRYRYLTFTEPKAGRDREYNDWYTNQHLGDVLAVPGIFAAQRFERVDLEGEAAGLPRYLTIYEWETEDAPGVIREIMSRAGTPQMPVPAADVMDSQKRVAHVYREITGRLTAD